MVTVRFVDDRAMDTIQAQDALMTCNMRPMQ